MSIFNNTEELLAKSRHQDRTRMYHRSHHRVVPASQRGQTIPIRRGQAMDVWLRHRQVRLPYLQDRRGHQA